jgi:hypothetical protein
VHWPDGVGLQLTEAIALDQSLLLLVGTPGFEPVRGIVLVTILQGVWILLQSSSSREQADGRSI